jgi:hypothetical protein
MVARKLGPVLKLSFYKATISVLYIYFRWSRIAIHCDPIIVDKGSPFVIVAAFTFPLFLNNARIAIFWNMLLPYPEIPLTKKCFYRGADKSLT